MRVGEVSGISEGVGGVSGISEGVGGGRYQG